MPSLSTLIRQSAEYILSYLAAHPSGKSLVEIQENCTLQGKQGPKIFREALRSISNQLAQGPDEKIILKVSLPLIEPSNTRRIVADQQGDKNND